MTKRSCGRATTPTPTPSTRRRCSLSWTCPRSQTSPKRKILWDNSIDLYRFPEGYLPDEFIEATTYEYDPSTYVPKVPAGVG